MGLVHTPRVLISLAKGLVKRRNDPNSSLIGVGSANPYVYKARAGLFDVDYLGHLNNAAYLSHAELARWEMIAYNGVLDDMVKNKVNFMVASTSCRYRREIRPLFRQFQIDTSVAGLDDRNIWMTHNFRYPIPGRSRIRAQIIVRGVAVQGREIIDPRAFFRDMVGIDKDVVERVTMPHVSLGEVEKLLEHYIGLEESLRDVAAKDDLRHEGH